MPLYRHCTLILQASIPGFQKRLTSNPAERMFQLTPPILKGRIFRDHSTALPAVRVTIIVNGFVSWWP